MSSRILSAYFDDFRKGKKQREELRYFLEDAIRKEPMRRGHFMGWLDQAQYEHPIPVTEFLLLRKEIEAALDNDDQTHIAHPQEPIKISPDADTLVAGDEEATVMAPSVHAHLADATEVSSGSQPSDMARLHDVPTLIGEPAAQQPIEKQDVSEHEATMITSSKEARAMTMPSVAAAQQRPTPPISEPPHRKATPQHAYETTNYSETKGYDEKTFFKPPVWLWLAGVLILVAALLGYWATRPIATVINVDSDVEQDIVEQNNDSTDSTDDAPLAVEPEQVPPDVQTDATPEVTPSTKLLAEDLSAADALTLLKERADQNLLLPLESPDNAHAVLRFLEIEYPQEPQLIEARVYLKDVYVTASKKAQGRGEWDNSQLLLDAAFEVLSPTVR